MTEVKFDSADPVTVLQTAKRVCGVAKDVTVAYIARGRDLCLFLYSLDEAFTNRPCAASSITVVSTSDGNRLRTTGTDTRLEDLRTKAIRSNSFDNNNKVQLLLTLVGGADRPQADNPTSPGSSSPSLQRASTFHISTTAGRSTPTMPWLQSPRHYAPSPRTSRSSAARSTRPSVGFSSADQSVTHTPTGSPTPTPPHAHTPHEGASKTGPSLHPPHRTKPPSDPGRFRPPTTD